MHYKYFGMKNTKNPSKAILIKEYSFTRKMFGVGPRPTF